MTGQQIRAVLPQTISLDGDWQFAYVPMRDVSAEPKPPAAEIFETAMPVPGYWDDHLDRMQGCEFWSTATLNPDYRPVGIPMGATPPDASLPYVLGIGWYRKILQVPAEWAKYSVTLQVGGVVMEAWVWLNGRMVGRHCGHSTPFEFSLSDTLQPGVSNELLIAVANTRRDRHGCVIRGYAGRSGGIYRPVSLKVTGKSRIKSCYACLIGSGLNWIVELDGPPPGPGASLVWRVIDPVSQSVMGQGKELAPSLSVTWTTGPLGMQSWSDRSPSLYAIEADLACNGTVMDSWRQPFGLRRLTREGERLLLNGRPVFLRGATEHCYYPLTCTPPPDLETYRRNIQALKTVGFNWLRFHTWVPSEEYMRAADELGMMIQVEPPAGFSELEWLDILRTCRKHPSVVIYCCGNEELLDEAKIAQLQRMAECCRMTAPDALFNPQEALRGVEYYYEPQQMGNDTVETPFLHNPRRLAALKSFSDVFGQYAWGYLSYFSIQGDRKLLDERMRIYERPCLSHELGIIGNYLNLDLERRYAGTRIGTDLFAATRRALSRAGLLRKASLYYRNSCAWTSLVRKHCIETARQCRFVSGYDFLGGVDTHWHRTGYPCGVLNEFLELKPGDSPDDILKYNGESVLLLDVTHRRNFLAGSSARLDLLAALYGESPLADGRLSWYITSANGRVLGRGQKNISRVPCGEVAPLGPLDIVFPDLREAGKVTLCCCLSGGDYKLANDWDFWVFPDEPPPAISLALDQNVRELLQDRYAEIGPPHAGRGAGVLIQSDVNESAIDLLESGARILVLGTRPFPCAATHFQPALCGRPQGNLATVIADHPALRRFPHDGYCAWQFYSLLEEGAAVIFDGAALPFEPIIEVVSSFKLIRKQAALFELRVGAGMLMVCALKICLDDPAAVRLLDSLVEYLHAVNPAAVRAADPDELRRLARSGGSREEKYVSDLALDPNAMK